MDVVCGRCRAEYEFDDALISERGTTVRCTSCGLQFKVFPPEGLRPPEVWKVMDPTDLDKEAMEYQTLRDLQKAIARGDVQASHLLSRGDDRPRPLSEIVELQPLLGQTRSDRPPARGGADDSTFVSKVGAEEIVPSQPPEPIDDGKSLPPSSSSWDQPKSDSRPRIRSALSAPSGSEPRVTPVPPSPTNRDLARTSIKPRVSLRSTLASSFPTPSRAGVPPSRNLAPVDGPPEVASEPPAGEAPPLPAVEDVPPSSRENDPPPSSRPAYDRPSSTVAAPINPRITESNYAGQLTPTPGALRAYQTADSAPYGGVAGRPLRRGAKGGAIVFAVLVGAGAFLLFANRDRLTDAMDSAPAVRAEETPTQPLSTATLLKISQAEEGWMLDHFFDQKPSPGEEVSPEERKNLLVTLDESGRSSSWTKVNLLRTMGRLEDARKAAGKLPADTQSGYSLALLDLAESPRDPPWPVILERLKDAAVGEGLPFLARSAYVYSLWQAGEQAQARAEYSAFGQLTGAEDSDLYVALGEMMGTLDEREAEEDASDNVPLADAEESEASADSVAAEPLPVDEKPAVEKPAPAAEPEPAPRTEPESEPTAKKISAEIQDKVTQADALWRGGNRDGALALYRQVVQAIGTSHFLGQRAAARIRQAEREKSASQ